MTEVATIDETSTELVPGQIGFNSAQRAMLAQLGLSDAPEGDLILFSHVCQKSGLDPFRREIYMIGRNTQVTKYVPNASGEGQHKETRWETVYTIQTGIQGFRKRARELADEKGDTLGFEGPFWCGEDGEWREVWVPGDAPVAAKYVVFRNGQPIPAVTHFTEYVQTVKVDSETKPNSMWTKMPRNQIAKCAEALAIQRAYPDELSGLVLEDGAQVIDSDGQTITEPTRRAPARARGVESLRDRAAQAAADLKQSQPVTDDERAMLIEEINAILLEADCTEPGDVSIIFADIIGDEYDERALLTVDQLKKILAALASTPMLGDKIRDVLNKATLAAENENSN